MGAEMRLSAEDTAALEQAAGVAGPVVLVNLFALRERAEYEDGRDEPCSGVVGHYPSGAAVLDLFEDPEYLDAYRHRRAAVRDQRVIISPAF
ncbi:hypothetical protein [Spirillospora albida]|uniref:hypothetical protein n=1 Tax=Spirillospora albida TaxID=58123 RepID=UPI0004C073BD|nr:hypothetical protein [Spirillospora albida]